MGGSPVAIANMALSWLGANPVVAVDGSDPSEAGQLLGDQFQPLVDAVTEDRDWTFATQRFQLAPSAVAPAWGYTTQFLLPPQVLRTVWCCLAEATTGVESVGPDPMKLNWVQEGRYILAGKIGTDMGFGTLSAVNIKAIVQVEDPTQWSPGFCQCVSARIAQDLCIGLTGNLELQQTMAALYEKKIKTAAANDGRQGTSQVRRANTIARQRR